MSSWRVLVGMERAREQLMGKQVRGGQGSWFLSLCGREPVYKDMSRGVNVILSC